MRTTINLRLITPSLVICLLAACATTDNKQATHPTLQEPASQAIENGYHRIYITRNNFVLKENEKGMGKLAKFGLGALIVAAAAASSGNTKTGVNTYIPVASNNSEANTLFDIFRNENNELTPAYSFAYGDQALYLDIADDEQVLFKMAAFKKGFFGNSYKKKGAVITLEKPEQQWDTVLAVGAQEKTGDYGLRALYINKQDSEFCRSVNQQAEKELQALKENKQTPKQRNKIVTKIISDYSSKFVATDSNLKQSFNFILACNAIRKATKAAPFASPELSARFSEQKEKQKFNIDEASWLSTDPIYLKPLQ